MAHSPLYGTTDATARSQTNDALEAVIEAFVQRFGALAIVMFDMPEEGLSDAGRDPGCFDGLRSLLMRADVVGRLTSGHMAALVLGHSAESARWEVERIWQPVVSGRVAPDRMPHISVGIAAYEVGDTTPGLIARASSALSYAGSAGGGRVVSFSRGGFMTVSDLLGAQMAPPATETAPETVVDSLSPEERDRLVELVFLRGEDFRRAQIDPLFS